MLALLAATLDYDVDAEGYTDKGGGNCSTEKELWKRKVCDSGFESFGESPRLPKA